MDGARCLCPTGGSIALRSTCGSGSLLVEAKLTEANFQTRAAGVVEGYRDLDAVFERELLPRVELPPRRYGGTAAEFPEEYSAGGGISDCAGAR